MPRPIGNTGVAAFHWLALADHVVLNVGVGNQALVLALQILNVPGILNRHRGNRRYGRD